MPYIKPQDRPMFDTMIDGLIFRTRNLNRATMRKVVANIVGYSLTSLAYQFNIGPITDGIIKDVSRRIRVRGDANYVVCRVVLESMRPEAGWSYHSLSDAISVIRSAPVLIEQVHDDPDLMSTDELEALEDCHSVCGDAADEITRRLLAPYEDEAIRKNGDMACFDEPFAYKPVDIDFLYEVAQSELGCGGYCRCTPPVAEAATDVSIGDAFTQDQYDEAEKAARKQG